MFITVIIDGFHYSICSCITIFNVLFYILSKQLSEAVHHICFMFHKRVGITVERDSRVFVAEDLGKRLYVHAALECAGSERMPQEMKAFVRNF